MKICVLSANLGGIDNPVSHVNQTVKADYHTFTDENFPPRIHAMTPRLQAKIPKMFGWELKPDYDVYLWLDGSIRLAHQESIQYFVDALEGHDMVFLKHPTKDTVHWEYRYNYRALHSNAPSNYMKSRYDNEWLDEQYKVIEDDPEYLDDVLLLGGVFMYRNTPLVRAALKEWWHHVSRYLIMDQLSLPYVLKKGGVVFNALDDDINDSMWLEYRRHAQ